MKSIFGKCFTLLAAMLIALPMLANSAEQGLITIKGKVVDPNGLPVIQASVMEQGTTRGTVTDFDGNYTLQASAQGTLEVSCIGYATQQVAINNKAVIDIILAEDNLALEETVVVGYATQKKANLTGAVATVNVEKDINSRTTNSISNLLAGAAPGLVATANNSSGSRPGANGASIKIRGTGTTNDSAPLVVVDGVVASMDDVNPADVENISVLKDAASSAIYGSRAANGVILITTKKGGNKAPKVTYNGLVSIEQVNTSPDYFNIESNYADYMGYLNTSRTNRGLSPYFSQGKIDEWRSHEKDTDPKSKLRWPNTDWTEEFFRTSLVNNHTVSVQGGSERARYFISGNFYDNPGVIKWTDYQKLSVRANLSVDVAKWMTIGLNVSGFRAAMNPNSAVASTDGDAISWGAAAGSPGLVLSTDYYGETRYGEYNNPEDNTGQRNANAYRRMNFYSHDYPTVSHNMLPRFSAIIKPFEGFEIEASYSYKWDHKLDVEILQDMDLWNFYPEEPVRTLKTVNVYNRKYQWDNYYQTADVVARYNTSVIDDNLKINALVGTSGEKYDYDYNAWRKFNDETLAPGEHNDYRITDLSAMTTAKSVTANIAGDTYEWAMRSYFGRLNLNWADKYLFEANLRADGSSRFAPNKRWGWFPSLSAGWVISEESFFNKNSFVNFLKLRASYGSLGNNSVGNYAWQSLYSAANYVWNNGTTASGVRMATLANKNITWEETTVTNIGADFTMFNSRLSGSFEVYDKKTDGILLSVPASLTNGTVGIPTQNAAVVDNKGFELSFRWNDKIGSDVRYYVSGNVAYNKNEVVDYAVPSIGTFCIVEGQPLYYLNVLEVDRLVKTQADLDYVNQLASQYPNMFTSYQKPELGDLLYKDVNGDGTINADDRTKQSNGNQPCWSFGLTFGAEWNGFDFQAMLNGVADWKDVINDVVWQSTPQYGYTLNRTIAQGAWTPELGAKATYPRQLMGDERNDQLSTFWMYDRAYLRLRNVQLGYTIPTKKLGIDKIRVFVSMDNAFTLTKWPGMDPELAQGRAVQNHPITRTTTFGVNVTL